MITNITPDPQKAKALRKMAEITLERLSLTPIEEYPSNTLNDYYDAIHKLMEALLLIKGIKVRGEGAHQELIDLACKELGLPESTREFLQGMRDYRNRISYEGFSVNKNYINSNKERIERIIHVFKDRFNE